MQVEIDLLLTINVTMVVGCSHHQFTNTEDVVHEDEYKLIVDDRIINLMVDYNYITKYISMDDRKSYFGLSSERKMVLYYMSGDIEYVMCTVCGETVNTSSDSKPCSCFTDINDCESAIEVIKNYKLF